jgi:hypothetical protein
MNGQAGKGDCPRPLSVPYNVYAANWEAAFGKQGEDVKANRVSERERELLDLVKQIDEQGTRLTKTQINFVANVIDSKQVTFSQVEERRIRRIHDQKVVNGEPEYD